MPVEDPDAHAPASDGQIAAMLSLLTDSSEVVVETSHDALVRAGDAALPRIERELSGAAGSHARRLRSILAAIRHPDAEDDLVDHLVSGGGLEHGALLVARLVDGGDEPEQVTARLDELAREVAEETDDEAEAEQRFDALRRVLAERHRLRGVSPDHAKPVEALLHGVTAGRGGMPLPLCMLWVLVARRAGVPLRGVNMPGHFLVRLDVPERRLVFDAYRGGVTVPWEACERTLAHFGMPGRSLESLDCDDTEMLLRTLRNLVNLADRDGDGRLRDRAYAVLRDASARLGR